MRRRKRIFFYCSLHFNEKMSESSFVDRRAEKKRRGVLKTGAEECAERDCVKDPKRTETRSKADGEKRGIPIKPIGRFSVKH